MEFRFFQIYSIINLKLLIIKKKVFSLLAVVLFATSLMSVSASLDAKSVDCIGLAFAVEEIMECEMDYDDFAEIVDWCEDNLN